MKRKYEITIAPGYVANWTVANAIRELLQNAVDAETRGHSMHIEYNAEAEELHISSLGASLEIQSLLLGTTTKDNDVKSIGQFGEGYKIATLVLLRNNKSITFHNRVSKEVWSPRFIKSRRFGCNLLGFFTDSGPRGDSLEIVIGGITQDEYTDDIVPLAIRLRDDIEVIYSTPLGDIINLSGGVFVGGLFVQQHKPYKYGYNFKPQHLILDRDRKLVSDFNLEWLASKMWAAVSQVDCKEIVELLEQDAGDVTYLNSQNASCAQAIAETAWNKFEKAYGKEAVPIETQDELEALKNSKMKPVLVPSNYAASLRKSNSYRKPEEIAEAEVSVFDRMDEWIAANEEYLASSAVNALTKLVDMARDKYE